ncbi:S-adenosyl-L-methionine-dependent methyltransferase, partial [Baffinella frigidus]
ALSQGKQWDVVVLDPPKLAPSRKDLDRAASKYKKFNKAAIGCVKPGGLLLSCTCSAAMAQSGGLIGIIREAAAEVGREVTLVSTSGAAADHPISPAFPEGSYLCAYLLAIS